MIKSKLKVILLIIICVVIAIGLVELLLRIIMPFPLLPPVFDKSPLSQTFSKTLVNGQEKIVSRKVNQWGFRGPITILDYKSKKHIFLIGSSTTQCIAQNDSLTWGNMLQQYLRKYNGDIDVYNAGMQGLTTTGNILMLHMVGKLEPQVIIFNIGYPDLMNSLKTQRRFQGNPYDAAMLRSLQNTKVKLFDSFRIIQILHLICSCSANKMDTLDFTSMGTQINPYANDTLSPKLPPIDSILVSMPTFKNNIQELIEYCKQIDAIPIFVFTPVKFRSYSRNAIAEKFKVNKKIYKISEHTKYLYYRNFYDALNSICRPQRIALFDFDNVLQGKEEYFIDFDHLSETGNAFFSKALGDSLVRMNSFEFMLEKTKK